MCLITSKKKETNPKKKRIWVTKNIYNHSNIISFIDKNYDIRRENLILYQKLYDIDKNGRQTISKAFKPVFKFKKNQREQYVKNEIKLVAQENLFMLKKLLSKNSEYSASKFEKQYQQAQKYKKNICHYPCIDFSNIKKNNEPIVEGYNFNKNKRCKTDDITKLPKIGGTTIKTNNRAFRISHRGPLDERYYKEATRSSRMNSTQKSGYKNTRYGKIDDKEASNIDEVSNEGSSSGDSGSGEGSGNGTGEGSGDGSGDGSRDGSGSGSGSGSD